MNIEDLNSYARLLNSINTNNSIPQGKQLHLFFLKKGILSSTISIANRLLQMYVKCGGMDDARRLFDEMPLRNCFTWNTLLEGYAKLGHKNDLLEFFYSMPHRNEFSWNTTISGLVRSGELDVARQVFDEMPRKNAVAWNTMIHGYSKNGGPMFSLALFKDFMKWDTWESGGLTNLDRFVLATVVGACTELGNLHCGKQVHSKMMVNGMKLDSVLQSTLVNMYGKCGDLNSASHLLNGIDDPDNYSLSSLISAYSNCGRMNDARRIFELKSNSCVVLCNSIISGYIANDEPIEALILFNRMQSQGIVGDYSTFTSVLSACSCIRILKTCIQLHSCAYKLGLAHDLVVASSLIDAYAKCGIFNDACDLFSELRTHDTVLLNTMITIYCSCGRVEEAQQIFRDMKSKSLISWNSMIVGLSQNGQPIEALHLFCTMNKNNLIMDKFSLAGAISACASIPFLELGEQIFARSTLLGLDLDQVIATSLIDFYCKCGFVKLGRKLFDQTTKPDEVSWNSMLMGYATNGYGAESLSLFHEMRRNGVTPTEITFTAVLSACDHSGLVEEGKKWFRLMKQDYRMNPRIEHYSCMIDLLARAGHVREAIDLVDEMPYKPDANMWSAILRGCVENEDRILAKSVCARIIELDPENCGALVQLSSLLASSGDWDKSALVRQLMREMRIQKSPGRSWCNY